MEPFTSPPPIEVISLEAITKSSPVLICWVLGAYGTVTGGEWPLPSWCIHVLGTFWHAVYFLCLVWFVPQSWYFVSVG